MPESVSGPANSGLCAYALEAAARPEGAIVTRFSVEMFRTVPAQPLSTTVRIVHRGRRMTLADVELVADDTVCARATAQFAMRSAAPRDLNWQTPGWKAPPPESLPGAIPARLWTMIAVPAIDASVDRPALPSSSGRTAVMGPLTPIDARQAWLRVDRAIVAEEKLSRFQAIAVVSDFCNAIANAGRSEIAFINPDLTTYLHREPEGEWIGIELARHLSVDGIANGTCLLHDAVGPLGTVIVSGMTMTRRTAL